MPQTYDKTTAIGKVRFFVPDTNVPTDATFDDDEIQLALDQNGGNIRLAAATLLEIAASNEALRLKVGSVLDVDMDGAALGKFLLERAKRLREDAQQTSTSGTAVLGFAIAEQTHGEFGSAELLSKEYMRRPA